MGRVRYPIRLAVVGQGNTLRGVFSWTDAMKTQHDHGGDATLDAFLRGEGRFRRTVDAWYLRQALRRPEGVCTWCGERLPKRRRSWCSDKCVQRFLVRTNPQSQRMAVQSRDGRKCKLCDATNVRLEVDHVLPVSLGGGLCDERNLRLLCRTCHKRVTAGLARYAARLRERQSDTRNGDV